MFFFCQFDVFEQCTVFTEYNIGEETRFHRTKDPTNGLNNFTESAVKYRISLYKETTDSWASTPGSRICEHSPQLQVLSFRSLLFPYHSAFLITLLYLNGRNIHTISLIILFIH